MFPSHDRVGGKGARKKALEQLLKIKPDQELLDQMEKARSIQVESKNALKKAGEFAAKMQDMERWFRNERWTDEIVWPENENNISNFGKQERNVKEEQGNSDDPIINNLLSIVSPQAGGWIKMLKPIETEDSIIFESDDVSVTGS